MTNKLIRKNIFLHFLDYDTQEMFKDLNLNRGSYVSYFKLRRALNVSILLCDEYCFMPPSFYFESKLTREIVDSSYCYIKEGLLRFPIRENNLDDCIEGKQLELNNNKCKDKENYKGYFKNFKKQQAATLDEMFHRTVERKAKIGQIWNGQWLTGIENVFSHDGEAIIIDSSDQEKRNLEFLMRNHKEIFPDGVYLWTYLKEYGLDKIPKDQRIRGFEAKLRVPFQGYYFTPYLEEYNASLLWNYSLAFQDFGLRSQYDSACDYFWFTTFLGTFLSNIECSKLLDCQPDQICEIKNHSAFNGLIEYYLEILNSDNFDSARGESCIRAMMRDRSSNIKDLSDVLVGKLEEEEKKRKHRTILFMNFLNFNNTTNTIDANDEGKINNPIITNQ